MSAPTDTTPTTSADATTLPPTTLFASEPDGPAPDPDRVVSTTSTIPPKPARPVSGVDPTLVADVRTIGAVGVVQLDHPVDVVKASDAAVEEGVWLRPFRDLIYTMPPYVTDDADVARITQGIAAAVSAT